MGFCVFCDHTPWWYECFHYTHRTHVQCEHKFNMQCILHVFEYIIMIFYYFANRLIRTNTVTKVFTWATATMRASAPLCVCVCGEPAKNIHSSTIETIEVFVFVPLCVRRRFVDSVQGKRSHRFQWVNAKAVAHTRPHLFDEHSRTEIVL